MKVGAFSTPRLKLASWRDIAADALEALFEPDVTRALPPPFQSTSDDGTRRALLAEMEGEAEILAMFTRMGDAIGLLILSADNSDVHIGYLFARTSWGQGYAGELLDGLQKHVAENTDVAALTGGVTYDNPASARVLERAGFEVVEEREQERIFRWLNVAAG